MTRYEMLEALSELGQGRVDIYDDERDGFFSWNLKYEGGDRVLTVRFADDDDEVFEYEWTLGARGRF